MSEPGKVYEIGINEDEACPRCGEGGASIVDGKIGLCMKCATRKAENKSELAKFRQSLLGHMTIGAMTIEQAKKEISALLDIYHPEIDASYLACDNDLTVNLKIKLQPHRLGGVDLGVGISFTKSKVNDAVRMRIDERQQRLFKEE